MYAITNAYDIRDSLKAAGATYDPATKAWIINEATFAKLNARTQSYGMSWMRGWAKAIKTLIGSPLTSPEYTAHYSRIADMAAGGESWS